MVLPQQASEINPMFSHRITCLNVPVHYLFNNLTKNSCFRNNVIYLLVLRSCGLNQGSIASTLLKQGKNQVFLTILKSG